MECVDLKTAIEYTIVNFAEISEKKRRMPYFFEKIIYF